MMTRIRAVEEAIVVRDSEQKIAAPSIFRSDRRRFPRRQAWYCVPAILRSAAIARMRTILPRAATCRRSSPRSTATRPAVPLVGRLDDLVDERAGSMGSTAIVGGTVPVGVGLRSPKWLAKGDDIVRTFIGDVVLDNGVFFESANFAVLRRLPVLFRRKITLFSLFAARRAPAVGPLAGRRRRRHRAHHSRATAMTCRPYTS